MLGLVPVRSDDPSAPHGAGALRSLGAVTLLRRAADVLSEAGCSPVLAVVAEPGLAGPAAAALRAAVAVVDLHSAVTAVVSCDVVVLHDPAHPLSTPAVVRAVLAALDPAHPVGQPAPDVALPVGPVADTLKQVDGDLVATTVDRTDVRTVHTPAAFRAATLAAVLRDDPAALTDPDPDAVVRRALAADVVIGTVPAPPEAFRTVGADDVELVAAILDLPG